MGANILGFPHFDEGHWGYISLNVVSGCKLKKNLSSIFHGHEASIFDSTMMQLDATSNLSSIEASIKLTKLSYCVKPISTSQLAN